MPDEVGHLTAGDAGGNLDHLHAAVGSGHQLWEGDARAEAERLDRVQDELLGHRQAGPVQRRRIEMDPADGEADAGRAEPVRKRQQLHFAVTDDGHCVHLDPVQELLDDHLAGRRLADRVLEVGLDIRGRLQPRHAALAARVGRLDHGREADVLRGRERLAERLRRAEPRLRYAGLGETAPHVHLVCQYPSRVGPDARQAERLGDGRHRGNRAVRGDRQHAVRTDPARCLDRSLDVAEVDLLEEVGVFLRDRVGVAVDRRDAEAELLRAEDGRALMTSGAEDENRLHAPEC